MTAPERKNLTGAANLAYKKQQASKQALALVFKKLYNNLNEKTCQSFFLHFFAGLFFLYPERKTCRKQAQLRSANEY